MKTTALRIACSPWLQASWPRHDHYIIPARRVVKYGFCDPMDANGVLALNDGQRLVEVGDDVCGRLDPY